jgi:hypothetical protein
VEQGKKRRTDTPEIQCAGRAGCDAIIDDPGSGIPGIESWIEKQIAIRYFLRSSAK